MIAAIGMIRLLLTMHACMHACSSLISECCAGVLPFAKKGDDRNNNLVRLQQMFPRIVAADFEHPKHVSAQGRHLLSRMLTSDPASRITIAEVCAIHQGACMPA